MHERPIIASTAPVAVTLSTGSGHIRTAPHIPSTHPLALCHCPAPVEAAVPLPPYTRTTIIVHPSPLSLPWLPVLPPACTNAVLSTASLLSVCYSLLISTDPTRHSPSAVERNRVTMYQETSPSPRHGGPSPPVDCPSSAAAVGLPRFSSSDRRPL